MRLLSRSLPWGLKRWSYRKGLFALPADLILVASELWMRVFPDLCLGLSLLTDLLRRLARGIVTLARQRETTMQADISRRVVAEFFGTFWLVLGGCGAAVLAAAFPHLGIGFLGVAFAFGLTVLTMAYAVGHISGGHFNPAVTIGLWSAGRCASKHVIPYIVVQVIGAVLAAGLLWLIPAGKP